MKKMVLGAVLAMACGCASGPPLLSLAPVDNRTGDEGLSAMAAEALRGELTARGLTVADGADFKLFATLERTDAEGLHLSLASPNARANVSAWGQTDEVMLKVMSPKAVGDLAAQMEWSQ